MREFTTAVADVEIEATAEDAAKAEERKAKVAALIAEGKTPEEAEAEVAEAEDKVAGIVWFRLDGRLLKAYPPTDGQLAFMLAALGRGQSADQRFASIINIMLSSLRNEDQDYLEGRLLLKADDPRRLSVTQIEEIFEYLTEEWFARPTQ